MIATQDIDALIGADAVDQDNDKIGTIGQVYVDSDSDRPVWVSVKSGLFGTSETLVPLDGADWDRAALHVAYSKNQVKDAPRIEPDGELSPAEQQRLYEYYGSTEGRASTAGLTDTDGTVGHDTSGPNTDDAITRSEERLRVGTQQVESGRVRLRKHVVTEQQTVTVPVSHEEVRLEREPITDANRGDALSGPDLSEEEHEVVLTEERPVVQKETVPVERVKLATETVTEQQQVTETVAHEEIDTDTDTDIAGTDRTVR
ncbi:DUF2382 domain-containing protein [uncultured Amnibacterium sp.]|uniref:DUF2382 domain-containing protein n=1 Tax=uncultured Amnibacterium sp. TaxID=1631851 RepID=UPI0035C95FFC